MLNNTNYEVVVIGGGINGTAIACDAAGRGLKVLLCEQHDLANATSSASSKLIHGGLRYLEQFEFRLVKESLREREILLKKAPHLVKPLEFVMPHTSYLRPKWMIRLGLKFYDTLSKRQILPGSKAINLHGNVYGTPLHTYYHKGFVYSDCFADDARLVISNAKHAHRLGATILTNTQCNDVQRTANNWQLSLNNQINSQKTIISCKVLINATGPWVNQFQNDIMKYTPQCGITLSKGSHIIVPKFYQGDHAYILQNFDKRIVFVIPYLDHYNIVGTTDAAFNGDPSHVSISDQEKNYLLDCLASYFVNSPKLVDIVWCYSGVRPLVSEQGENLSSITRDYRIMIDDTVMQAPLITIYGGKLTTHRRLAEITVKKLTRYFPLLPSTWTADKPLPGGDIPNVDMKAFYDSIVREFPWLNHQFANRLVSAYGTELYQILQNSHALTDLGCHFGHDLYEKEVAYLVKNEWAYTAEDILWRRSKLGLRFTPAERDYLNNWLNNHRNSLI